MAILEERYQISEQIPSKIGVHWKFFHLLLYTGIAISGLFTAFIFQKVREDFNNFCVLNAKIEFAPDLTIPSETRFFNDDKFLNTTYGATNLTRMEIDVYSKRIISLRKTHWGSKSTCDFAQFTPIVSTLLANIWGTFFVFLSKGGSGYRSDILPSPWRIVFPCFIFSAIYSIVVFSSTITLAQGMDEFCAQFQTEVNITKCNPDIDYWTLQFHKEKKPFFQHYDFSKKTAYIGLITWLLQVFILFLRIVTFTDFRFEFVQIRDKEEEVQKITNLTNGEQV